VVEVQVAGAVGGDANEMIALVERRDAVPAFVAVIDEPGFGDRGA